LVFLDFCSALPSLLIDGIAYFNTIYRRDRRGKKPDTRYASRFTRYEFFAVDIFP